MGNMRNIKNFIWSVGHSPLLWGIIGAVGFYALVIANPFRMPNAVDSLLKRYFAGHPVEYLETFLFAVGLAGLIIKAFDITAQRTAMRESLLPPMPREPQPVEQCEELLARLDRLPPRRQGEYYAGRLRAALEHLSRRGSADALDDELKYLAEQDAARMYAGYGLFRMIVWAVPILGFLGTVIGITMALNGVDLRKPDESMFEVLNGLGVKFDTTALALTLAIILMFVHYCVERAESRLVEQVDRRTREELGGRFEVRGPGLEGQAAAARRMAETVLQAANLSAQRQADTWRATVEAAARQWSQMAETAAAQVQAALDKSAGELARRAESLQRAVEAAGEIARLEDALNHNLAALSGAKHFEQTALNLAAAANLLNARLAELPPVGGQVRLEPARRAAQAA
jgi:hypothetical protein